MLLLTRSQLHTQEVMLEQYNNLNFGSSSVLVAAPRQSYPKTCRQSQRFQDRTLWHSDYPPVISAFSTGCCYYNSQDSLLFSHSRRPLNLTARHAAPWTQQGRRKKLFSTSLRNYWVWIDFSLLFALPLHRKYNMGLDPQYLNFSWDAEHGNFFFRLRVSTDLVVT